MITKLYIAILSGIIIIFIIIMSAYTINSNKIFEDSSSIKKICFKDKCFSVELAISDEEKADGLMFRENLGENQGMLFIYDTSGIYPFWMKNTLVPLDIIWLDENLSIVHIEKALPCSKEICKPINPGKEAKYVLEINADTSIKYNINLGDRAIIK